MDAVNSHRNGFKFEKYLPFALVNVLFALLPVLVHVEPVLRH